MKRPEVGLDGGKSWSHFLSAKVGVDTTRMRSARQRRSEHHQLPQ